MADSEAGAELVEIQVPRDVLEKLGQLALMQRVVELERRVDSLNQDVEAIRDAVCRLARGALKFLEFKGGEE
ncbi:MAG: hypothetical protein ACXQTQ_02535 [Candidatus Hecatellaceae archaeon]|nr:MAG: hypothetical protein DRO46_05130 [Candidatus Hecatellales archaeon]